jgi:hypothetical protein
MPKILSTLDNTDSILEGTSNFWMTSGERTKLSGIATGAEVNQNAFSTIIVSGQSNVEADSKTDSLTLIAGSNITLTTNATNDSVTIAATDTNTTYTASTGLTLTSTAFSLTDIIAGSASVGAVKYNGVTQTAGAFYGSTTNPTNVTRLNYSGYFYATQLYEGSTRVSVTGHTHTGTAVGRTISASAPSGGADGDVWYII